MMPNMVITILVDNDHYNDNNDNNDNNDGDGRVMKMVMKMIYDVCK